MAFNYSRALPYLNILAKRGGLHIGARMQVLVNRKIWHQVDLTWLKKRKFVNVHGKRATRVNLEIT
jgi:hypothetical protein